MAGVSPEAKSPEPKPTIAAVALCQGRAKVQPPEASPSRRFGPSSRRSFATDWLECGAVPTFVANTGYFARGCFAKLFARGCDWARTHLGELLDDAA